MSAIAEFMVINRSSPKIHCRFCDKILRSTLADYFTESGDINDFCTLWNCENCDVDFEYTLFDNAQLLEVSVFYGKIGDKNFALRLMHSQKVCRIEEIPNDPDDTLIIMGEIPWIEKINPTNCESIIRNLLILI